MFVSGSILINLSKLSAWKKHCCIDLASFTDPRLAADSVIFLAGIPIACSPTSPAYCFATFLKVRPVPGLSLSFISDGTPVNLSGFIFGFCFVSTSSSIVVIHLFFISDYAPNIVFVIFNKISSSKIVISQYFWNFFNLLITNFNGEHAVNL